VAVVVVVVAGVVVVAVVVVVADVDAGVVAVAVVVGVVAVVSEVFVVVAAVVIGVSADFSSEEEDSELLPFLECFFFFFPFLLLCVSSLPLSLSEDFLCFFGDLLVLNS